jgi:hypothetical protein
MEGLVMIVDFDDQEKLEKVHETYVNVETELALDRIRKVAQREGWRRKTEIQGATVTLVMSRQDRKISVEYYHGRGRFGHMMQVHTLYTGDNPAEYIPLTEFEWTWRGTSNSSSMIPLCTANVNMANVKISKVHAYQYLASIPSTIDTIISFLTRKE